MFSTKHVLRAGAAATVLAWTGMTAGIVVAQEAPTASTQAAEAERDAGAADQSTRSPSLSTGSAPTAPSQLPESPPTQTQESGALNQSDIIVTAAKREERLQDVPISVTVLGGAQLSSLKITNGTEIARQTPNLRVSNRATRTSRSSRCAAFPRPTSTSTPTRQLVSSMTRCSSHLSS